MAKLTANSGITQEQQADKVLNRKEIDNLFKTSYAPVAQASGGCARCLAGRYVLLARQRVGGMKRRTADLRHLLRGGGAMHRLAQFERSALLLLVAAALFQTVACTGYINTPPPVTPAPPTITNADVPCPANIADQATNICPRLKNITLSCGGNGKVHFSLTGGSGSPFVIGIKFDEGSVFSAVLVIVNCQDGPHEGVTFGVTYTGQVSMPTTGPPCISQSKAVYSQFLFGDPLYAVFEGLAKDQMHQTLDDQAIGNFASSLSLPAPATSRCSFWRQMP
jgi:hypothetical protein